MWISRLVRGCSDRITGGIREFAGKNKALNSDVTGGLRHLIGETSVEDARGHNRVMSSGGEPNTGVPTHASERGSTEQSGIPPCPGDGASITAPDIAARYGIPETNQRHFQQFSDRHNIVIDVRPANPASVPFLEQGALPKPMSIKAKSINELDAVLGMSTEHVGLVGYFEPVMPATVPADIDPTALRQRYDLRYNEFHALQPVMQRYTASGEFAVRDGVVHMRDNQDILRPVTSDHDLFDIRHTDGSMLDEHEFWPIIEEMRQRSMGVQHGPHMYWQPHSEFERQIFQTIVEGHQPGREPLIRFAPDTAPTITDATAATAVIRPELTAFQHGHRTGG
ncbi:hypothetical protein [Nocardia sp. CY41]|uniref:hypothetical protein n=1 Tax=Nocardia sp. CY41 TaxID=2608686 RepID=UPI00135BD8A1|nr:hypothetical protein [Nocardia sp. CY41]